MKAGSYSIKSGLTYMCIKEAITVRNNTDAYVYMQSELSLIFLQMYAKKGIELFGERSILEMIK